MLKKQVTEIQQKVTEQKNIQNKNKYFAEQEL